jgi:hypothetical protein
VRLCRWFFPRDEKRFKRRFPLLWGSVGILGVFLKAKIDLKSFRSYWLRGLDLNQRPLGYEPNELPDCSTPHLDSNNLRPIGSNLAGPPLPAHVQAS